jgi:hypothetical protein
MWFKKKKETRVEFLCNGKSATIGLNKLEVRRLLENSTWMDSTHTYGTIPFGLISTVFDGLFSFDREKYAEVTKNISVSIYEKACWEIID